MSNNSVDHVSASALISASRRLGFTPRVAVVILLISVIATIMEAGGLTMLLPVFQFIQAGGDMDALRAEAWHWRILSDVYAAVGVPLTLISLMTTSFICIILRQICVYTRIVYTAAAQEKMVTSARSEGFRLFMTADAALHDKAPIGEVVNDLTTELRNAVPALFGMIMMAICVIMGILYATVLVAISWRMMLAATMVILLAVLILRRVMRRTVEFSDKLTAGNQSMSSFMIERFRAARLVRLSGTEAVEQNQMDTFTNRQRNGAVEIIKVRARFEAMLEPVVVAFAFVLLFFSVTYFKLKIEEIGLFLVIMLRLLPVAKEIVLSRQGILAGAASMRVVMQRLNAMTAATEPTGGTRVFRGIERDIRFEAVHFVYPNGERPALNAIDLIIPARKMTALVGPSGGGKSTLVDMLPRLRDPDSGWITIDGIALDQFSIASLRGGIAYAPQTPQIFDVTVAEHVRYGRQDATDAEIRDACDLAGAAEFVERLPQGYDTRLGQAGGNLSGGQRQRIDLARALVRRAPLLILDEPTSALDAESERAFRVAVERIRSTTDMTIVIIGHRLSTVVAADQIVVLRDGAVAEIGSHDDLMRQFGWYARAFASQIVDSAVTSRPPELRKIP